LRAVPEIDRSVIRAVYVAFLDRLRADDSVDARVMAQLEVLLAGSADVTPEAVRAALWGDEPAS